MAKYLPLQMIDTINEYTKGIPGGMLAHFNLFKEKKWIPENAELEQYSDFVFSSDFFNPEYKGPFEKINHQLIFDKNLNNIFVPHCDFFQVKERRTEWVDILGINLIIHKWEGYKIVYKPDNDFFHELKNTQNLLLTKEIFTSLPFNVMYIDLSNVTDIEPFIGAFVYVHNDNDMITAAIHMAINEHTTFSYYSHMNFREEKELPFKKNSLPEGELEFIDIDKHLKLQTTKIQKKDTRHDIINTIMQILTFISVKAPDISENPNTKKSYKPSNVIKNKFSEVQMYDIGIRYGNAIRTAKKEIADVMHKQKSEKTETIRKPIRPHIRCAHWQRYHTGHGRSETITKWIPPVYVCGKTEIQVVIHELKK